MKTLIAAAAALALSAGAARAQDADVTALQNLGSDYALGFHIGDAARMLATTHRDLSKRGVRRIGAEGPEALTWLEGDMLRYAGAHYDDTDQFDESTQRIVNVFEVSGDVAVLELIAGDWFDAFTAIRTAEGWRLLDCVWGVLDEYEAPDVDAGEAAEAAGVMAAFAQAAAAGHDAALDRVMHAQAQMRGLDRGALRALTRDQIYAGLGARTGAPEPHVFNATRRTALGRVRHGGATYWLQLLRIDGAWRVVNVHWRDA
ncbi:MAG: nuclear transport factor 2 family protein [Hyphomonadaceae bacterium]